MGAANSKKRVAGPGKSFGPPKGTRIAGRAAGVPNKQSLTIAQVAREYTGLALDVYLDTIKATKFEVQVDDEGNETVVKIPRYSNPDRQRAADTLLDRGWGRPTQAHLIAGQLGGSITVTHAHTVRELEEIPEDELVQLFRATIGAKADSKDQEPEMKTIEHEPGPSKE